MVQVVHVDPPVQAVDLLHLEALFTTRLQRRSREIVFNNDALEPLAIIPVLKQSPYYAFLTLSDTPCHGKTRVDLIYPERMTRVTCVCLAISRCSGHL